MGVRGRWRSVGLGLLLLLGGALVPAVGRAGEGTAEGTAEKTVAPQPRPGFAGVDWRTVDHPLDCGRAHVALVAAATGDATGDGVPETAVAVSCATGAGNPPASLYVYAPGDPAGPVRLLATLVTQDDDVHVRALRVDAAGIGITGDAYSAEDVPQCCPDVALERRWTWSGSAFTPVRAA